MMGDMIAKCDRKSQYMLTIRKESLHKYRNDNGQRLISFAASDNITLSIITFPHKSIHKAIWKSSDDRTRNQIIHVLIEC